MDSRTSQLWSTRRLLRWTAVLRVPFTYALSKNRIYQKTRRGHVTLSAAARLLRSEIASAVEAVLDGRRIVHDKLWISILVRKPDHRGDAINVVDLVCDAIQDATGLDDRWYCLGLLDWEISKSAPTLVIGLGQESEAVRLVCSRCGQLRAVDAFSKHRGGPCGRDRVCRQCRSRLRKSAGSAS